MGFLDNFWQKRAEAAQELEAAREARWDKIAENSRKAGQRVRKALDASGAKLREATIRPVQVAAEGIEVAGKGLSKVGTLANKAWESNIAYDISEASQKAVTSTFKAGKTAVVQPTKMAWKIGKYGALGAAGVGLLAYLASSGKKKVSADDVELPPMDTVAMANFDAPAMLAEPPKTLMGLQPVEGEHVNRLGKSGQQNFRDIAPPRAALDAGFEDVSTVPTR